MNHFVKTISHLKNTGPWQFFEIYRNLWALNTPVPEK